MEVLRTKKKKKTVPTATVFTNTQYRGGMFGGPKGASDYRVNHGRTKKCKLRSCKSSTSIKLIISSRPTKCKKQ